MSDRQRLHGVRIFITFSLVFLLGAFSLNMWQANRTGAGYGWGDTVSAEYRDEQALIVAKKPLPEQVPGVRSIGGEVIRVTAFLVVMVALLLFWYRMLDRLGSF